MHVAKIINSMQRFWCKSEKWKKNWFVTLNNRKIPGNFFYILFTWLNVPLIRLLWGWNFYSDFYISLLYVNWKIVYNVELGLGTGKNRIQTIM